MADQTPADHGEFEHDPETDVPVEKWVQHPVSDSADYLDREPPTYVTDEGGSA